MALVVMISHPVRAESEEAEEENITRILQICGSLHEQGILTVVPYFLPRYSNHASARHGRSFGERAQEEYLKRRFVDEIWLYGDGSPTEGMYRDIALGDQYHIPVVPKTPSTIQAMVRYDTQKSGERLAELETF